MVNEVPVPIALAEELSVTLYPEAPPKEVQYTLVPFDFKTCPFEPAPYVVPLDAVGALMAVICILFVNTSPINREAPFTIRSFNCAISPQSSLYKFS